MTIDTKLLQSLYKSNEQQLTDILDKMPSQVLPTVTQTDAKEGFIIRYFVRQVTDKNFVVEVDNNQYQEFKENPRFVTTTVKWKIVGKKQNMTLSNGVTIFGVEDANRVTVSEADLTFGGLLIYITSYVEYWFAEEV
jgi:hypothetical protein